MPYYDEHGNEVDGLLTPEEADKKIDEANAQIVKQYEEEKQQGEEKAAELQKAAEDAKNALEEAKAGDNAGDTGDKETNLANLRKKLQETEAALQEQQKANEDRWQKLTGDTFQKTIDAIAGEDEDLKEKIKHHYETTLSGVKAETESEIREKVVNAVKLAAAPKSAVNPMDVALGAGPSGAGIGGIKDSGAKVEFNETEKQIGRKLGISDDDYKKYGNDPRLKT